MEQLKYIIEDRTIAALLGEQNFTNKESAILELVKNAYDAGATLLTISFDRDAILVADNGLGMDADDIRRNWMHIGKSDKDYLRTYNTVWKKIIACKGKMLVFYERENARGNCG